MTPEEYQILIDAGYTIERIKELYGEDPPPGWQGQQPAAPTGQPVGGAPPVPSEGDSGIPDWVINHYNDAMLEYQEALRASKADTAPYMGFGTRPSQVRLTNAQNRLKAAEITRKYYETQKQPVGRTDAQEALAAAQAAYYQAQAANVGKPTPKNQTANEAYYDLLRNRQLEAELAGLDPKSQQWQQTFGQNQAKFDYEKDQDELQRQQVEQQQKLARQQAAWRAASDMIQTQQQMAPYALRPGQEYHTGWEPGGMREELARKLKLPYNPETFRVAPVDFDWEQRWREATGLFGGQ